MRVPLPAPSEYRSVIVKAYRAGGDQNEVLSFLSYKIRSSVGSSSPVAGDIILTYIRERNSKHIFISANKYLRIVYCDVKFYSLDFHIFVSRRIMRARRERAWRNEVGRVL